MLARRRNRFLAGFIEFISRQHHFNSPVRRSVIFPQPLTRNTGFVCSLSNPDILFTRRLACKKSATVADDEELLGVITDRDIAIRAVAEGRDPSTPVREIMSEEVAWASEDDSVEDAARIMSDHQIRRLPVVDAEQHLVGIVSLGDFAVDSADIEPVVEALSDISRPS